MQNFIKSFTVVPTQLFRLNAGSKIKLREFSHKRSRSYDILAESGMVKPKARDPETYAGM